jgi:glycosyltransferase involved in cell wall biosynthesis
MTDLVLSAADADIGIFAPPGGTVHMEVALPNKIFEYVMAGLALVVSPREAMGDFVRATGVGVVTTAGDARAIADAINGLTPDAIDQYKRVSLNAARTLCWEVEKQRLLDAVGGSGTGTARQ